MKLRKELVAHISGRLVDGLTEKELIDASDDVAGVTESVITVITSDLMVEDELNDEVKVLLEEVGEEIDSNNVNYHKMFLMVKQKLARERGLIL